MNDTPSGADAVVRILSKVLMSQLVDDRGVRHSGIPVHETS
jgi:hypothetical protein